MELKDIAAALSIGETRVRKRKSQDKWATEKFLEEDVIHEKVQPIF